MRNSANEVLRAIATYGPLSRAQPLQRLEQLVIGQLHEQSITLPIERPSVASPRSDRPSERARAASSHCAHASAQPSASARDVCAATPPRAEEWPVKRQRKKEEKKPDHSGRPE